MTRVAVVGHVEWAQFVRVPRLPIQGEVLNAASARSRAAGGGAVAAAVLAELGAEVDLFCALGSDEEGAAATAELSGLGITVHPARRAAPTRRAVALLDDAGERTILTIGDRLEPRGDDALDWKRLVRADGAYLTAGDPAACRLARAARVLVATPRVRNRFDGGGPRLDALVFSAADRSESEWAQRLRGATHLMVATEGAAGGHWWGESEGRWEANAETAPPRARRHDSYGCGDAFAAAFTYGLARGMEVADAAAIGAHWGAAMLGRTGAP
ncbi:MAG: PfkB family carbohydrate kinase [Solirubrobacteraceae bacterium]